MSVDQIAVQLGDLTISISRSSSSRAADQPPPGGQGGGDPPPPGPAKAKPEPKRRSGKGPRFYCVTRVGPERRWLLGIHHCVWADIVDKLPGTSLFGSGCHLRAFDTRAEAEEYWVAEGWQPPAPFHGSSSD